MAMCRHTRIEIEIQMEMGISGEIRIGQTKMIIGMDTNNRHHQSKGIQKTNNNRAEVESRRIIEIIKEMIQDIIIREMNKNIKV